MAPVTLNLGAALAPKRIMRSPNHPFSIRHEAYQLAPFLIAPVLPGETMKNFMVLSRIVTDPLKSKLLGWWFEQFIFYVKLRDIDHNRDETELSDMMLERDKDMSAGKSTSANAFLSRWGSAAFPSMNYVAKCRKVCIESYFRDEGETETSFLINGQPSAAINQKTWLDSVIDDADYVTAADVDVDALEPGANIMASEIERAMRMWEFQRAHAMTDMSFEDYLATFGEKSPAAIEHKPELLRHTKNWSFPTNTIDPTDGAPTSAVVWTNQERLDKDIRFSEPGFIFGLAVARPKVYLSKQAGAVVDLMDDALNWLPMTLSGDAMSSMKKVTALEGPLTDNTDAYWVDIKDLFLYGEQFCNFALTETDAGMVALPTAALQKEYASDADVDALWVTPAGSNLVRSDGIVSMTIAGHLEDTTPTIRIE